MKYIQTVLGKIKPEEMGFTLPHEHVFWDLSFYAPEEGASNETITLENVAEMRYDRMKYPFNLVQQDFNVAVQEVTWFREAGGSTICDNGCYGLQCDPVMLQQVSLATQVHILRGTGAYLGCTLPEDIASMDVDTLAALCIKEIREGIGDTGIRCGFIGEIGIESGVSEASRRSLAAAAIAQKETGAAITIHQPGIERHADTLFKIITDNGGNLTKTVMCHCDPYIPDVDYVDHIAKSGAYISSDFFGLDIPLGNKPCPTTDNDRIDFLYELIRRGNLERILISHDVAYKFMLRQFGGFGYAHIPKRILPFMEATGFEPAWLKQITVDNPRQVFSIEE